MKFVLSLVLFLGGSSCLAQVSLSRRQAVEDIDFYIRTMQDAHYNPFMYISRDNYNARINAIKGAIGDTISTRELILLFYQVTALLNDAHSTPLLGQPVFQTDYKKDLFFPYKMVQEKNRCYAPLTMATALGIPAGAEIIDINGQNLSALFQQVRRRMAGTPSFREEAATRLFCYFLFLKNVQPPFVLGYKDKNGIYRKAAPVAGVPFRKALSATLPHIIRPYNAEVLQGKLGYIDVRSLSGDINTFRSFLDTSFATFRKANIRALAIDLRENSGGNTDLGDLLFSYISHKKYSWGIKSWKISETYKNYLKAGGDTASDYLKKPDGSIWVSADNCRPGENRFRNDIIFDGNVFFITGPFTFSSAMAVADVVKEYKMARIIGEPTGENVKDFGEAFVIDLPNSKIKIQSTTSLSHGANCNKINNGPVLPDIAVRSTLEDKVQERDPVVEYLLKEITSN